MKLTKETFLIASFVAILTLGFIVSYVQKNQESSRAAGPTATFTMTPATGSIGVNQEQAINVVVSTDLATNKISGADLIINATGPLEIVGVDMVSPPATGTTATDPVRANSLIHSIAAARARVSYIMLEGDPNSAAPASDANLPAQISLTLRVKGTAAGNGTITIDTVGSQVVGNVAGNVYTLAGVTSGTYTVGSGSGTVTPTGPYVNLLMNPASGTLPLGANSTTVTITTNDTVANKVSALELTFLATGSMQLTDVVPISPPLPTAATSTDTVVSANLIHDIQPGKARVSYIIQTPAGAPAPDANLPSTVTLKVLFTGTAGSGSLAVDTAVSQVVGNITQNVYQYGTVNSGAYTFSASVTPSASPTVSVTPSITPSVSPGTTITPSVSPTVTTSPTGTAGNVTLDMKLKFQGILKQPKGGTTMKVQVSVGKEGFNSQPQTGTFTVDTAGIWSGTVSFADVPAGNGYRVYVKGPRHLKKRVCTATPTETASGTYRCADGAISLKTGSNKLDMSGIYMLVGDLPAQDGVVDSYDTAYIQLNLGSTDQSVLAIGDLNMDGIVDTQDWSLVIASLNVKYDEL